jgi:endogenous inhibitor of DNA gyrase (YacG/DUF329 family)
MFKCEICAREFENLRGIKSHVGKIHKKEITIKEYYLKFIGEKGKCPECGKDTSFRNLKEGYSKFCSLKCSNNSIDVKNKIKESRVKKLKYKNSEFQKEIKLNMECKICGKKFETLKGLTSHIGQIHKNEITIKEYYLKFIGEKGKCKECGKDTRFNNLKNGYSKFCSSKCSSNSIEVNNKKKETCFKNSGYKCPMQDPEIRKKHKQSCFENSGYEYPSQDPKNKEKKKETILKNYNGIHPSKLTFQQVQERYPDLVKIEGLIEGPNGEIWGHCKNSSCKNSEENGGYFDVSKKVGDRNDGINKHDTGHFYCSEECKHTCILFNRSAVALDNLLNENKVIPYTPDEYNTWKEEVYYRQRIENNTDTNFCEYCHATENLQVHHEVPQKIVPGYALDPINGIIACKDCHYEKGHKKGTECSTGNLASKICK